MGTLAIGVLVVTLLLSLALLVGEEHGCVFWVVLGGLLIMQLLTDTHPFSYIRDEPKTVALVAVVYLPIGVLCSIFLWWQRLKRAAAQLKTYMGNRDGRSSEFWESLVIERLPQANRNKGLITAWIACWPLSMAGYVVSYFLVDVGNWIYEQIGGVYASMTERVKRSLLE